MYQLLPRHACFTHIVRAALNVFFFPPATQHKRKKICYWHIESFVPGWQCEKQCGPSGRRARLGSVTKTEGAAKSRCHTAARLQGDSLQGQSSAAGLPLGLQSVGTLPRARTGTGSTPSRRQQHPLAIGSSGRAPPPPPLGHEGGELVDIYERLAIPLIYWQAGLQGRSRTVSVFPSF